MMLLRTRGTSVRFWTWTLYLVALRCFAQVEPARQFQPVTIQQAVAEAVEKNLNCARGKVQRSHRGGAHDYRQVASESGVERSKATTWICSATGYNAENNAGPPEYSIRTDFVFERGAKRQRRIDVAQAAVSTAQLQFLNTVRSVVLDVQSAFVELLQAKADLALAEETLEAFRQTVQVNTSRVRSGDLAEVELIRTQVAELQFENTVAQARLKVESGDPSCRCCSAGERSTSFPMRPENCAVTSWQSRSMTCANAHSHPARITLPCSGTLRGPKRNCGCNWRRARWTIRSGTEYRRQQGLAGTGNSLGIFFSSNLPVFNRNQGEIERARQEQSQAEARIRAIQATIENEVETAYLQYRTARESLRRVEETMLAKATDVRQITDRAYRRGGATFLDFLDAQRAYNDTVQLRNTALAEFAKSLYTIDAATGISVEGVSRP